jgi:hypothetical protein
MASGGGAGKRTAPARAAVRHVAEVLRELGVRVPVAEHFRLAKFDSADAVVSVATLAHDLVLLHHGDLLSFDGPSAAARKREALGKLEKLKLADPDPDPDPGRPDVEVEVLLAVAQWGAVQLGYRRRQFVAMEVSTVSSFELLVAVGWLVGRLRVLDRWVAAAVSSLWYTPDRDGRLLTHYDDDIGCPVDVDAHGAVPRPAPEHLDRAARAARAAFAETSTGAGQLRRHACVVGRASRSIRALAGELVGKVKRAHRLRASYPAHTPAQLHLLCHPELHQRYAARLAAATARLRDVLAAEEEHHAAWWRWLASLVAGRGVDDAALAAAPGGESASTDARRQFLTTLAPLRDGLARAHRGWGYAQQRLRQDVVRAERSLGRVENGVFAAAATECPRCRQQRLPTGAPTVVCLCAVAGAAAADTAELLQGGCRKTVYTPKVRPGRAGSVAQAGLRGTVPVTTHTDHLRHALQTLDAELQLAAKANADLMMILLAKAPGLVMVK